MPPNTERQLRLPDGRRLGYAEFGAPRGRPVFFFHGFPGSRLEAELAATAAARWNLRIIAADRPGIGLSDRRPGRTLANWADDVRTLADSLGLERFAVLGISGGGPYAIACAARLADRLTAAGTIGGLAPLDRPGATAGMSTLNRLVLFLHLRAPAAGQRFTAPLPPLPA